MGYGLAWRLLMNRDQHPLPVVSVEDVTEVLRAQLATCEASGNRVAVTGCDMHGDVAIVSVGISSRLGFEVLMMTSNDQREMGTALAMIEQLLQASPSDWQFDTPIPSVEGSFKIRPSVVLPSAQCEHIDAIVDGLGMQLGAFVEIIPTGASMQLSDHVPVSVPPIQDAPTFSQLLSTFTRFTSEILDGLMGSEAERQEYEHLDLSSLEPVYPQPQFEIEGFGKVEMSVSYMDLVDHPDDDYENIRTQMRFVFEVEGTVIGQMGVMWLFSHAGFDIEESWPFIDKVWFDTLVGPDVVPWPEIAAVWDRADSYAKGIVHACMSWMAPAFQSEELLRYMAHSALWTCENWSGVRQGMTLQALVVDDNFNPQMMSPAQQEWHERAYVRALHGVRSRPYAVREAGELEYRPRTYAVPGPERVVTPLLD